MIKEFECKNCGDTVDIWERFDDVPPFCKKCGGDMKKIISRSSFILRGTGWAFDNYGSKSNKKSNK